VRFSASPKQFDAFGICGISLRRFWVSMMIAQTISRCREVMFLEAISVGGFSSPFLSSNA
jgi:hypothetical protein